MRAVKNSSRVRGTPIASTNFRSPVCEYTSPSRAGGMPSFASSDASRRSHDSASSSPPPIAWPFSAATDGNGSASSAAIASWNGWATSASALWANSSVGSPPMS